MSLARPWILFAALPLAMTVAWLLWRRHRREIALASAVPAAEARGSWAGGMPSHPKGRAVVLGIAVAMLCAVAAGPGFTLPPGGRSKSSLQVVFVIDASLSMAATDVAPSRIERAGAALRTLADELPEGRFAVMSASDWTSLLAPPTSDRAVVRWFGDVFRPALIAELVKSVRTGRGDDGVTASAMIGAAASVLGSPASPATPRVALVMTDGALPADTDAPVAARHLREQGGQLWIAVVGADRRAKMELEGRVRLDARGVPELAGFDPSLLRKLAEEGGGRFESVNDSTGVSQLASDLRALVGEVRESDAGPRRTVRMLLLCAFLLVAMDAVRR